MDNNEVMAELYNSAAGAEQERFKFDVPFNNETMVAARKKQKIGISVLFFFMAAILFALAFWGSSSVNDGFWVGAFFGGLGLVMLILAFWQLFTTKPNPKNDGKKYIYFFFEDYLRIDLDKGLESKTRSIANCLYRRYKNKQYVRSIVKTADRLTISILTGTYNGAPQYAKHVVPTAIFNSDADLHNFEDFLQQKLGGDYKIKESK